MRLLPLLLFSAFLTGCASTYEQDTLKIPESKLSGGKSVLISTPTDGFYGDKVYPSSGNLTALATRAAFSHYTNESVVAEGCSEIGCLKSYNSSKSFDYYAVLEILHWEDRNTEWSGKPDQIKIALYIFEGESWKELASTIISGKSKVATWGGDHPQDLLAEPIEAYISSLF